MSFEELRANSRGWLRKDWAAESKQRIAEPDGKEAVEEIIPTAAAEQRATLEHLGGSQRKEGTQDIQPELITHDSPSEPLENTIAVDIGRETKSGRPRKTKLREVKGETQTSMPQI